MLSKFFNIKITPDGTHYIIAVKFPVLSKKNTRNLVQWVSVTIMLISFLLGVFFLSLSERFDVFEKVTESLGVVFMFWGITAPCILSLTVFGFQMRRQ